jgi:formate hydrogenlyase subunit 6/NADH:ubiquinone oxidoreductase subunit I
MKNKRRLPGRIVGMTLGNLFHEPATIKYPAVGEKPAVEKNYRGRLRYDSTSCVNCGLCMKDCPTGALKIINDGTREDKKMRAELNVSKCIFCCQCVDSCHKNCLSFSQDIDLSVMEKDKLHQGLMPPDKTETDEKANEQKKE